MPQAPRPESANARPESPSSSAPARARPTAELRRPLLAAATAQWASAGLTRVLFVGWTRADAVS